MPTKAMKKTYPSDWDMETTLEDGLKCIEDDSIQVLKGSWSDIRPINESKISKKSSARYFEALNEGVSNNKKKSGYSTSTVKPNPFEAIPRKNVQQPSTFGYLTSTSKPSPFEVMPGTSKASQNIHILSDIKLNVSEDDAFSLSGVWNTPIPAKDVSVQDDLSRGGSLTQLEKVINTGRRECSKKTVAFIQSFKKTVAEKVKEISDSMVVRKQEIKKQISVLEVHQVRVEALLKKLQKEANDIGDCMESLKSDHLCGFLPDNLPSYENI